METLSYLIFGFAIGYLLRIFWDWFAYSDFAESTYNRIMDYIERNHDSR
jgi:hypothetical protein